MKNLKENTQENLIRLPYFDWDKAKFFYYVAKLGSLSEAGKFLNISQPSLSRKISILEDHLKCKLFIRTPKGLELTRKGDELFGIIERTFLELKGFSYNAAVSADKGQKRKIRILTTHAMAAYIFNDLILEYGKHHPELSFELIGNDQFIDLIFNDVDIAIRPIGVSVKDTPKIQGFQQEYLFSLVKKLYASSEYLAEYGEPQSVEELKNHRLLAHPYPEKYPYSDVNWILTLGMPEGKLHEPYFATTSVECMIGAAKKSIGIVASYEEMKIVKESNLNHILPAVKSDELKEYIIYPDHLKNDSQILELKNYLAQALYELKFLTIKETI